MPRVSKWVPLMVGVNGRPNFARKVHNMKDMNDF